jgi:hypothetical protein
LYSTKALPLKDSHSTLRERRIVMLNSKRISVASAVGALGLLAANCIAHGNERGTAKATIGSATVTIDYGRPTLKGRDLMKLIQPGSVWRIGSDAPTTIESDVDLDFGGTRIPKGKHILLAHYLGPSKWSLIVSSKPASQFDPGATLAEVPMKFQESKDSLDEVTIQLSAKVDQGIIEVAWGSMRLEGSFSIAK